MKKNLPIANSTLPTANVKFVFGNLRSAACLLMAWSLLLTSASICPAQDDVAILLRRVPESADALLIVRLSALLDSPRGQQENWSTKYQLGYLNGAVRIPPSVKSLLLASEIHPDPSKPSTTFGVALLNSRKRISMSGLAIREGGQVVTVADQPVVLTSRNSFIAELAPGFMGAMTPPDRKEFARWMRFAMTDRDPVLSPYLRNAVSAARGAHIQLAVDLRDFIDPKQVKLWLMRSKKLEGSTATFDPLIELVKGMRGIRFTARVKDTTTGEVYLDFSQSVADRAGQVRDLFMESLDEFGAAIDEFRDCPVRTEGDGRTVVLRAELEDATMREIMSLIQMPSVQVETEDSKPSPTYSSSSREAKPDLAATTQYFNAVQQLLDDLRRKAKKADDYNKTAHWHETYAKRIHELPRQGVDREMVEYGDKIASQLWALANSLRGVPLKVELLDGQKYYYAYQPPSLFIGRGPGIGWGGTAFLASPTYTDTNIPQVISQQREAVAQGDGDRAEAWKTIDQERYRIRRRMSEKFKTDFGQTSN